MTNARDLVNAIKNLGADEIRTHVAEVDAELRMLNVMLRAAEAAERAEQKAKPQADDEVAQ